MHRDSVPFPWVGSGWRRVVWVGYAVGCGGSGCPAGRAGTDVQPCNGLKNQRRFSWLSGFGWRRRGGGAFDTPLCVKPERDPHGFGKAREVRLFAKRALLFAFAIHIAPFVKPIPAIVILEFQAAKPIHQFLSDSAGKRIQSNGRIAPP